MLTSNYEGLPVALLESMARGCIPIVTDLASGIPDVIRHGENGFVLPRGDIASFLECLDGLQKDRGRRQLISDHAFKTIATGPFGIDTVVDRYDEVIDFVRRNIESGHYVRPKPFRPNGWAGDFVPPAALQISPDAYYSLKWHSDRQAQELAALNSSAPPPNPRRSSTCSRARPLCSVACLVLRGGVHSGKNTGLAPSFGIGTIQVSS